jgi:hypothetical protein
MRKPKGMIWLFSLAGALGVAAGFRDLLAPDFLNPGGRATNVERIALNFAIGTTFLVSAWHQIVVAYVLKNRSKS